MSDEPADLDLLRCAAARIKGRYLGGTAHEDLRDFNEVILAADELQRLRRLFLVAVEELVVAEDGATCARCGALQHAATCPRWEIEREAERLRGGQCATPKPRPPRRRCCRCWPA